MKRNLSSQPERQPIPAELPFLIELLRSAITGVPLSSSSEELDFEKVFRIAKRHKIAATVYPFLPTKDVPESVLRKWKQYWAAAIQRVALFQMETSAIYQKFEQGSIDYLPIKGAKWRELYGARIREFADADILIHADDAAVVSEIMEELGYAKHPGPVHDEYFKEPIYHIEIHKQLFAKNQAGFQWAENVWSRGFVSKIGHHRFQMREDDYFIYELLHMYKHFSGGGIGLRQLADFWLLNKDLTARGTAMQPILNQLKEFGCDAFYTEMCTLAKTVFERNEEIPEKWLEYWYTGGCYGTINQRFKNQISQKGMRLFIVHTLIPERDTMVTRFPILEKHGWMLPIVYVYRLVRIAFLPRQWRKLPAYLQSIKNAKKE